ncbi:semaphorin-4G [Protopterus annectens]|uniref:semaphorin-4G n=1 Tax=Protopterus annectens TaxID=7888 RepID=UPI001CF9DDBD|nr:semaphorin-4G [Protopterus annectens]
MVKQTVKMDCLYQCLLAFVIVGVGTAMDLDVTPRITIPYSELVDVNRFINTAVSNVTMLLEDDAGILYVGARGAIFSLNARNITDGTNKTLNWEASPDKQKACEIKGRNNKTECFNHIRFLQRFNETHLYVCGTFAFSPLCGHIDIKTFHLTSISEGKEKCPFDPSLGYTGVLVDGKMYTATEYEFQSTADIRLAQEQRLLKTEDSHNLWLVDAKFVGSALIQESVNSLVGDDDKIYFFFTEGVKEKYTEHEKPRVSRVARVCKGDVGGQRILQKKWTSFLKARIICSIPEFVFYFDILTSTFVLDRGSWQTSVFYGTFTSQWKNVEASAICRYSLADIQSVFEGPYMEYMEDIHKWTKYEGELPSPRPGLCITNELRMKGQNTSKDLPDKVLGFQKLHPLMYDEVKPIEDRPLLLKKNALYTRIAVDQVMALDGQEYDVMFIGTDDGYIHKAVVMSPKVHIIEEVQLFRSPEPVEKLVISKKQKSLYIGSLSGVVQIPLSNCSRYITCYDCILARDPYCGWNGDACIEISSVENRTLMVQDIVKGSTGCSNSTVRVPIIQKVKTVQQGADIMLFCDIDSNLASTKWQVNNTELNIMQQNYKVGTDGLLILNSLLSHTGNYSCYKEENGVQSLVAVYAVSILMELPTDEVEKPSSTPLPSPTNPESWHVVKAEVVYIAAIIILGGVCVVLMSVLFYVACLQNKTGKYHLNTPSGVELQTVSGSCGSRKAESNQEYADGFLQIIPGEAVSGPSNRDLNSPVRQLPPPPPVPPPLPTEFTNGITTLPSMLKKMNGNTYMLLRQNDEASSPLYHSFTEELSKILEKRKHTQLVEKPDESSV